MDGASVALKSLFSKMSAPDQATDSATDTSDTSTSAASSNVQQAPSVDKVTEEAYTETEQTVAPAVEHDTISRQHETRERDVIEREVHKDYYHTTVQPLKDREVEEMQHDFKQAPTEYRVVEEDDGAAKAKAARELASFHDTVEEGATTETQAKDETVVGVHVHNHYHETIQPVIEKEIVKSSVTHVTNPIKETIHEQSQDTGVTTASAMSVEDFKHRLDGEAETKVAAADPGL